MTEFLFSTDGYKLDHRRQYPPGTEFVYSNWTARSSRIPGAKDVVFFGLQYFLEKFLIEIANETFFSRPVEKVCDDYKRFVDSYLGPNDVGVAHIRELHKLGYVPLLFCALPEGTSVPLKVPMFTVENTHKDFFWVTNYIETALSSYLWLPCTSASTAKRYRNILEQYAELTGEDKEFVRWQGHDFSFRGMSSPEAAALSGAGHLLSFAGTDSIPSIRLLQRYYDARGLVGGSVPATEHSVMCAGGQGDELETFRRLLKLYPKGILSVVSDTWDLWKVITEILPKLKDEIMARDGKLVIRPDSGDPEKILCGDSAYPREDAAGKGVVRALWDLFGGTVNEKGFKVLDPHIGAIYGDSITEERAYAICKRLGEKGFASTNVVLGIGSYTYQYVTRDTNGFAVKATWAQINGKEHMLQKDPVTDNGGKKSAKGRVAVLRTKNGLKLMDELTINTQLANDDVNFLRPVWKDGKFIRRISLAEIRKNIKL